MAGAKRVGGLVESMQAVRRRCDETLRDRGDPDAALRTIPAILDDAAGDVQQLRGFAPGLGDLWDTLRSVTALACEAASWRLERSPGQFDAGLLATDEPTADVGGSLFGEHSSITREEVEPE